MHCPQDSGGRVSEHIKSWANRGLAQRLLIVQSVEHYLGLSREAGGEVVRERQQKVVIEIARSPIKAVIHAIDVRSDWEIRLLESIAPVDLCFAANVPVYAANYFVIILRRFSSLIRRDIVRQLVKEWRVWIVGFARSCARATRAGIGTQRNQLIARESAQVLGTRAQRRPVEESLCSRI